MRGTARREREARDLGTSFTELGGRDAPLRCTLLAADRDVGPSLSGLRGNGVRPGRREGVLRRMTDLRKYSAAFYLKSTALVMPILPLWWTVDQGVPLGTYLSLMAAGNVFSMVIDLPLSFFSDRLSHAAFYASGLFVLGSAFTAQILLGGTPALLTYVVTTAVADALISGADASLLVDVVGENRYRDTYRHLNRHFYLYTAAFFLAGVGLYYLDPRALMALQGLMLWSGATLVARIRPRASGTPRGSRPGRRSSPWETCGAGIRRYALGVPGDYIVIALVTVMLSAFFDGLMQFQNRTIQVIAADAASARFGGGIWTSAVLLALGNAASSAGLGRVFSRLSAGRSAVLGLTLLLPFCVSALVGLASGDLILIAAGYMLLCVVKGVYRPLVSALVVRLTPDARFISTWISAFGILAGIVSSAINFGVALGGNTVTRSELIWAALGILLGAVALAVGCSRRSVSAPLYGGRSPKRTSKSVPLDLAIAPSVVQEYPPGTSLPDLKSLAENLHASGLRSPKLEAIGSRSVSWEYVDGVPGNSSRPLTSYDGSGAGWRLLVSDLAARSSEFVPAFQCTSDGFGTSHDYCAALCRCRVFSHCDLHPGNILILEDDYRAVGWDRAHYCSRLFDELTLVVHPWFSDRPDAYQLMRDTVSRLLQGHDDRCPVRGLDVLDLVVGFARARYRDVGCQPDDGGGESLAPGYRRVIAGLDGLRGDGASSAA